MGRKKQRLGCIAGLFGKRTHSASDVAFLGPVYSTTPPQTPASVSANVSMAVGMSEIERNGSSVGGSEHRVIGDMRAGPRTSRGALGVGGNRYLCTYIYIFDRCVICKQLEGQLTCARGQFRVDRAQPLATADEGRHHSACGHRYVLFRVSSPTQFVAYALCQVCARRQLGIVSDRGRERARGKGRRLVLRKFSLLLTKLSTFLPSTSSI